MKHSILRCYLTVIVTLISFWSIQESVSQECNGSDLSSSAISNQIDGLELRINRIQELLQDRVLQPDQNEFWYGNQSSFGSFKRLSTEAKKNLTRFQLENTEDLEIDTLLRELRPCVNLESIKLNQVELLGVFPNTSAGKLTLPKLHEFEIILTNYPKGMKAHHVLSDAIFFQKEAIAMSEFKVEKIFELSTNIKIGFSGYTVFSVHHGLGQLVLYISDLNFPILTVIDPKIFKLRRLIAEFVPLKSSDIPSDLTYLNLKYVKLDEIESPISEFNDLIKNRRELKSVHFDVRYDSDFGSLINLADLPPSLEHLSLRQFRVNTTSRPAFPKLKSILLDGCLIDGQVFDNLYRSFPNIRKIAILFHWNTISEKECHPFLYDLVTNDVDLPQLESVVIDKCSRHFNPESKPIYYDEIEEFLTNLGLGKSGNFYLERTLGNTNQWVWSGRNTTQSDIKLIKYEFSDWKYLNSWENYSKI